MLDLEQPAQPDSAAAPAASSDPTTEDTSQLETQLDEHGQPIEAAPVDDEAEDELDGVKLRGKKDALERLKAERLMQSDYTRKTQEVAEHRKNLEAERAQFQQTAQGHQQHIREVAQLVNIDDRLAQFANFDFNAAADSDPVQALKLHNEFTRLQAHRAQLVGSLTQKQQAQAQQSQRESAKQILEARQVLERDIKGWSPELANKLTEYGRSEGYASEVLDNVTRPEFVKTLHKAYLYDQLQKQRIAKPPATPATPVTRIGGGSAATTKPLSEVTDPREWAERRQQRKSQTR